MANEASTTGNTLNNNQGFDQSEDEIDLSELIGTLIEAKWLIALLLGYF